MSGTSMNRLDRLIAWASPETGRKRVQARAALEVMAHYKAGDLQQRSAAIRAVRGDADAVAQLAREGLMLTTRDVVRNNALAGRALSVIVNNVIGTGIEPHLVTTDTALRDDFEAFKVKFGTVSIDTDGVNTMAGIQRLALAATVTDGEALLVWDDTGNGLKLRVLESDYLDDRMQGALGRGSNVIYDGIEYDQRGRRVAYHLFDEHPGSAVLTSALKGLTSRRVDASRVVHLYRVDRPGQRRGVSWFAPVLDDLVALADNDEAQMLRQKIAACFAVFWRSDSAPGEANIPATLSPGAIQQIGREDEVQFVSPPDVTGYDDFGRVHLRRVAVGLGITYESLTGDLSNVNFSSARLGRIDMGQNVESWQWGMVIPRLCHPIGQMMLRQWVYDDRSPAKIAALAQARIDWTPPPPVVADPKTETQVAIQEIEAGLASRHAHIRRRGYTPTEIDTEIAEDMPTRRALAALKAPGVAAAAEGRNTDTDEGTPDV